MPKWGLRIAGLTILAIGIAHFFMPEFGYDPSVPAAMDAPARAHFFYLGTYAIGGFLIALGAMSVYASKLQDRRSAALFAGLMTILWGWRTVLEIVYPVELRLFVLDRPTQVLLPVMSALTLIYAASAGGCGVIAIARERRSVAHGK